LYHTVKPKIALILIPLPRLYAFACPREEGTSSWSADRTRTARQIRQSRQRGCTSAKAGHCRKRAAVRSSLLCSVLFPHCPPPPPSPPFLFCGCSGNRRGAARSSLWPLARHTEPDGGRSPLSSNGVRLALALSAFHLRLATLRPSLLPRLCSARIRAASWLSEREREREREKRVTPASHALFDRLCCSCSFALL